MVEYNAQEFVGFVKRQFQEIDQNSDQHDHSVDIMLQIMVDAKKILRWNPTDTGIDFSTYVNDFKTRFLLESLLLEV